MPTGWIVVEPPEFGTIASSVKKCTASLSGQQPEFGPLSTTLKKSTSASIGQVDPAGGFSASMKKLSTMIVAQQIQSGSISGSIKKRTFAGQVVPEGNVAATIKKRIASINTKQTFTGSMSMGVKKRSASMSGAHRQSGTMAGTVKKRTASASGNTPLIVTNTLSGSTFDSAFWGGNNGTGPGPGVYLSGGVIGSNTVGGFFGSAIYRSWIICKTQFSANGCFIKGKLNAVNGDDRGALLWVGMDSSSAPTKGLYLAFRVGQASGDQLRISSGANNTLVAGNPPTAFNVTDEWIFEVKKIGSDYRYRAYQNGATALTYTDTNGTTFGAAGRYVAAGSSVIQVNFNNYQATNGFTGTITCGDAA